MPKKNRYSIKRNYTKRRRQTRNRRNKKRKKTHGRHNNKRKKTNMKGGDGGEPKPYPNPNPIPDPIPVPPDPSPKPEPVQSLRLISSFEDLQAQKLYLLSSSDDLLYIYIDYPVTLDEPYYKSDIQEHIDSLVETNDPRNECSIKMYRDILSLCDQDEYSIWMQVPLYYRIALDYRSDYLCTATLNDGQGIPDLFEASFNYINSIYNIYEIDEWPKFLPPPPIQKSNKISILQECSEEYIKQNKNKMECNRKCCPNSGYVCGMVDDPAGPKGTCIKKEKTGIKQNPTY